MRSRSSSGSLGRPAGFARATLLQFRAGRVVARVAAARTGYIHIDTLAFTFALLLEPGAMGRLDAERRPPLTSQMARCRRPLLHPA